MNNLNYPTNLELPIGSMELNLILCAHEAIISRFKLNKRFIEKELSNLLIQAKKMKKTCKDSPDLTIAELSSL